MNFDEILKSAKALKEKMNSQPPAFATGTSGAGLVSITIDNKFAVTEIDITEKAIEYGVKVLNDLVKSAMNDAINKMHEKMHANSADMFKDLLNK